MPQNNITIFSKDSVSLLTKLCPVNGVVVWSVWVDARLKQAFFHQGLKIFIFYREAQESPAQFPRPGVQKMHHSRQAVCGSCWMSRQYRSLFVLWLHLEIMIHWMVYLPSQETGSQAPFLAPPMSRASLEHLQLQKPAESMKDTWETVIV